MAFDLASAKPVEADAPPKKGGFDLGSSKPVAGLPPPTKPPEPPPTFTGALMGGAGDLMKYGPPVGLASMGHRVGSYFDHKRGEFADYAGGKVTDYGAQLGLPPEASAGAGTAVNAGIKMGPDSLAGGAFGKLAAPPVREAARGILQSAMKPTMEQLKTGKAARAVDTMLDQGINVTQGGMDKLHGKITQLDDKIGELIQNSPATIEKTQVARYLHDAYQKFIKEVNPQESLRTIEKAWADFMNHPLLPGEKIGVEAAHDMKRATTRSLGEKAYGELKGPEIEAQKTLARGLKEEIAKAVPDVRRLSAEESDLMNALSVAERRVLMDANKNPIGLGWLTLNPVQFAGWMADRSPGFKSLVARMLNAGAETGAMAAGAGAGAARGAVSADGQLPPPPQAPPQAPR